MTAERGPTMTEFVIATFLATTLSFRFIGIAGIIVFLVVMTMSREQTTQWLAFGFAFIMFLLPIDVRTTNTTMHHGQPESFVSVVHVFAAGHNSHSRLRRIYTDYYTSHITNHPIWVIPFDVVKS
jgi:hypothetical protein